jgi:HK97 family phage major capsid protein
MSERIQAQTRALIFDLEADRGSDGAIPVVVSTDAVVEVADGPEILVHSPEAIDLQRAPLPIIATHRGGQVNVGLVDSLQAVGGKLRGMARFGTRPEASGYREDVLNGIIRSVSVGYARIKARVRNDGVLVTERWMPSHVAMVAEPADVGAGFYRAAPTFELTAQPEEVSEEVSTPAAEAASSQQVPMKQKRHLLQEQANDGITGSNGGGAPVANQEPPASVPAQPRQGPSALDMENERKAAIVNLCRANNIDPGIQSLWISSGASVRTVSDELLTIIQKRAESQPKVTQVGLTASETRRFSMSRAIDACATQNWTNAGFEAEVSRTIAGKLNRTPNPNKFYVPWEVQERQNMTPMEYAVYQLAKRDLTVASAGAGGYLKETTNVGFIELLRNKSVLFNMGAMRLSGLQGDVTIPKQSATGSATWLANESASISEINQTFVQVALSPKNVGGYTEISRQLLLQSNPSAEGIVMSDLATVVALDIDLKGLNGSGASGQPTGILNTSGIGSVTGTSLAYDDIIEFQTDVFGGNALTGNSGFVTTGAVAGLCKQRVKFSNTASPLWEGRLEEGSMDGYRAMASNQMPSATMLFGDFGLGVVVAEWGVLEVEVNPFANFQAGIIGVRAIASVDIGVRYPTAFSAASSIT